MLKLIPDQPLPAPTSPYEQTVVDFCRLWLSGRETFVLHTSGSTGTPKPIHLTRRQMAASAHLTGQTLGLQPGDSALCCLNVAYVAGVMMLVRALELRLTLTVVEPVGNPLLAVGEPLDFAAFVPLQLQQILETPATLLGLDQMKAILVGGAAVSPALEMQLQRIDAPVFGTYGMTETVSHVALRRLNGPTRSEWYHLLLGVAGGTDARGCLWVRGPMTNDAVVQTNDVVEWGETAAFRWLGRFDNVINSGGVKIQPERVELLLEPVLREAGFAGRFFLTGLPDQRLGQEVALVLEGSPFSEANQRGFMDEFRTRLGRFEVPRRWLYVPRFAETPTGKVDKLLTLKKLTLFEEL